MQIYEKTIKVTKMFFLNLFYKKIPKNHFYEIIHVKNIMPTGDSNPDLLHGS